MVSALTSAVSGMQVSALRMDVSANNIANVNTPGFEQSDLVQVSGSASAVSGTIRRIPNPDPTTSGTDLAKEMGGEMTTAKTGYSANLKVIKTQDEMLGSLLDIKR